MGRIARGSDAAVAAGVVAVVAGAKSVTLRRAARGRAGSFWRDAPVTGLRRPVLGPTDYARSRNARRSSGVFRFVHTVCAQVCGARISDPPFDLPSILTDGSPLSICER